VSHRPTPSPPRVTEPPAVHNVPPKPRVDVAAVRLAMRRTGGRFTSTALRRLRERP
jgi:hypothetical protein